MEQPEKEGISLRKGFLLASMVDMKRERERDVMEDD